MDYFGIIKRAYKITAKNRFLWIFGILIAGAGGASIAAPNLNIENPASDRLTNINSEQLIQDLAQFWSSYGNLVLIGTALLLTVCVIFFIFGVISQGALIGSVDLVDSNRKADFKTGFAIGAKNFWRIWGVAIIYLLMILASLCLLIMPVCVAIIAGSYAMAIGWGIIFLFVCLVFWVIMSIISPYSTIIVVLEKLSVWESIRKSLHLFQKKLASMIIIYLLLLALGIAYNTAIFLIFLIIGGLAFTIGVAFWLASVWAAVAYAFTLGLIIVLALIIVNGAFKAFCSAVLVLTYNELKSAN